MCIVTIAAVAAIVIVQVYGEKYIFSEWCYMITIITFVLVLAISYITK